MLYERREDDSVDCSVCPRLCHIRPGQSGACRARVNRDGTLYAITYGRVCSVAADPVEKKPLYHFFPGTTVLSLGSLGCNFACRHCQNWQIAHADPAEAMRDLRDLPVRNLPVLADHNGCQGIAWTYNEPTIWLEYILDGAQLAHEHGLYTVMVTNGYITEEALDALDPHIDAYRVDVKGFPSEEQYQELLPDSPLRACSSPLPRCAEDEHGCHIEDRDQRHPYCERRRRHASRDRRMDRDGAGRRDSLARDAVHAVSRILHLPRRRFPTLQRAVRIGEDAGLRFVYVGNVAGHEGQNTKCPNCKRLLVRRTGDAVEDVALRGSLCSMCGANVNVRTAIR